MIKQIAGRAGRRNSPWPEGRVACRAASDVPLLRQALDVKLEDMRTDTAGLFPEFEHLEARGTTLPSTSFEEIYAPRGWRWNACVSGQPFCQWVVTGCSATNAQVFAGQLPEATLPQLLTRFGEEARLDGTYFFCKLEPFVRVAKLLERVQPAQPRPQSNLPCSRVHGFPECTGMCYTPWTAVLLGSQSRRTLCL